MDSPALTPLCLNGRMVDLRRGVVFDAAGCSVTLRPQSAEVLKVLSAQAGVLVTKDELIQAVWGTIAVTDDSLVQCIKEIRRALGDEKHQVIKTAPKRGYLLELNQSGPAHVMSWRWIGLTAAVLLAIGLALWFVRLVPTPLVERAPSIAVLPFDDMNADRSLAYLGDGVAEDIISMLARSPDVRVVARNSSFTYGGRPADIRKIGQELGVDYVLEGSVRKEADKLRIVAQLNDASTGIHLWAERFDKSGADPWALQDEVTQRIIAHLTGEKGQLKKAQYAEAWGKGAASLGEYDYYLRGLDVYMHAQSKEAFDRAGSIWREGLKKFPESPLLKAKLGWYHWTLAWDFWSEDTAADFRAADQLVSEVLATDNLAPQVQRIARWLNAFVLMQRGDFERAVKEAEIATAIAPYDARMLRQLTEVLTAAGRYKTALDWLATAEPREPGRTEMYHQMRGNLYRLMKKYGDSIREYALAGPLMPYPRLSLAIVHVRLGQLDEARMHVRAALRDGPNFTQARWRAASFYSDPTIVEAELADLATAGLPAN